MTVWTVPALRAEIEYRQERVRRDWPRRIRRRWVRTDPTPPVALVRPSAVPAQRTAGPGERVPVGSGSGSTARGRR